MGEWISYTIVAGLVLLCLHLVYSWFMASDNQPRFNRAVLLGCYGLALVMPLMDFSFTSGVAGDVEIGVPVAGAVLLEAEIVEAPVWPWILSGIYMTGVLTVIVMTITAMVKLSVLVGRAEKYRDGKYTVAIVDDETIAPFSWMRYIVMNRTDFSECRDLVIAHETEHLDRYHGLDLVVARVFEIVMWYNPAAWLMTSSLRSVHEYEADRAVIERIDNQREYQMLLIKKAVGRSFPVLANSLNHSNLKKRITMMLNPKSSKTRRVRALAIVPAVAVALLSVNMPFMARAIDSVSSISLSLNDDKGSENTVKEQPKVYLDGKEITNDEFKKVKSDSIKSISVLKDRNMILVEKYKQGEAIPEHQASGYDMSEIVVVGYGSQKKQDAANGKEPVFSSVEEMPRYPGGEAEMMKFVSENIKYPESEMANEGRHRVIVQFVVGADGAVREAKVLRSASEAFDAEALRVVGLMPKFIPGKLNGKPVSVSYVLPITFAITSDKSTPEETKE